MMSCIATPFERKFTMFACGKPLKQSFKMDEVIDIVKNSNYFDDLSLVEAVQLRDDIFDLKEMSRYVDKVLFDESLNRWVAKYSNRHFVLPLWIGNILGEYCYG